MSTVASANAGLNKQIVHMNVKVSRELRQKLRASANLDGMTLRDYVTAVLEEVVAEDRRFRLPRARAS